MSDSGPGGTGWWGMGAMPRGRKERWGRGWGGAGGYGGGPWGAEDMGCVAVVLGVLILLVSVVVLPPLLAAAVLFFPLRRVLARRDWAIMLVAAVVVLAWYPREHALGYGAWLLGFLDLGDGEIGDVPYTTVISLTVALAAVAGLAAGPPESGASVLRRKRLVQESITPKKQRRLALQRRIAKAPPLRQIPAVRGPYATERSRRTPLRDKAIPLGVGKDGRLVHLSARELGMHGAVVGSTGSGKTVTLMWLVGAALDMGFDVSVIDMKEDTEPGGLRDFLRAYAAMHAVPLQEVALGDEQPAYWFNVLEGMSPDEAFDTIVTMVHFDDAFWQALNRKVLQQVIQLCFQAARVAPDRFGAPTMLDIGKIMESGAEMKYAVKDRVLAIDQAERIGYCRDRYTNVLRPSEDEAKSAASFGTRLTGLYDSTAGRRILVPGEGREMIDVRRDGITYVGLNSLGQPDMAKILSSSALQRLSVDAAHRIQGRVPKARPRLIVVDEANFIDREIAMNMLSRVRAALFNMILCTQGPTDWIDKDGDDWSRLTQNINWLVAMAQSSPEAAEKCAEFLGMRDNAKVSQQVMYGRTVSMGMVQEQEEFIVTPKELRDLGTGEAYLRVNKPDSRVAYLAVPMRLPELDWYTGRAA